MFCCQDNFSWSEDKTLRIYSYKGCSFTACFNWSAAMLPYGWAHCCSQACFCTLCVSALANVQPWGQLIMYILKKLKCFISKSLFWNQLLQSCILGTADTRKTRVMCTQHQSKPEIGSLERIIWQRQLTQQLCPQMYQTFHFLLPSKASLCVSGCSNYVRTLVWFCLVLCFDFFQCIMPSPSHIFFYSIS